MAQSDRGVGDEGPTDGRGSERDIGTQHVEAERLGEQTHAAAAQERIDKGETAPPALRNLRGEEGEDQAAEAPLASERWRQGTKPGNLHIGSSLSGDDSGAVCFCASGLEGGADHRRRRT